MGRPKKVKNELEQQPDVQDTGLVYKHEDILPTVEEVEVIKGVKYQVIQEVTQETIHDKYRMLITMSNSNYINGYSYPDIIEILRWCEKKLNRQMGMNMSCGTCILDLVKLFGRLEDKK